MKAGINQWAFPEGMAAAQAISLAKEVGFEAFEVCIGETGPVPLDATEGDLRAIRRHADQMGIELTSVGSGLGWQYPISSPNPKLRSTAKETFARVLQMAQWLGVDAVLTVPGAVTADVPYDVALENALAALQDLAPTAEKHQVCLAVENVWNKFLLSPVEMRDFIDQCQSDCVGAYFDIGNIIAYGYPEQWIRILGDRIRMVHAKDYREAAGGLGGFVMLMEGDVNWRAVMAALRDVGYDKALVAEYGPYAHSLDAMLHHALTSLRTIIAL